MNVIKREQNDAYKAFGVVLGTYCPCWVLLILL